MNREEILLRAKRENYLGDEREREVRLKRDAFSLWGLIVLGAVIMIIKIVRTESPADIISLLFCTSGLGFTYEGLKLQQKYSIIAGIVLLILAACFFCKFCMELF